MPIAVRPFPNKSYETPSRGFHIVQLGMSFKARESPLAQNCWPPPAARAPAGEVLEPETELSVNR